MSTFQRHDILVELASDQVNQLEQMFRKDEYQDAHMWLHPILLRELKLEYADHNDDDLEKHYCDQLGIDIPSSPTLSSADAETQKEIDNLKIAFSSQDAIHRRPVFWASGMECSPVSSVYPVSDAQGVAEVAASLRSIARREENVHGIESETEIRIPMRLLFRLVHGEGSLG